MTSLQIGCWVRLAARYTYEWSCNCCPDGERTRTLPNGTLGRITDAGGSPTVAVLIDGMVHTLPFCSRRSLVPGAPTKDEEAQWLINELSR